MKETNVNTEVNLVVIQQNVGSLHSNDRYEELLTEIDGCKWDAILQCETWRFEEAEIWESHQGNLHLVAGSFDNKHGAGIYRVLQ